MDKPTTTASGGVYIDGGHRRTVSGGGTTFSNKGVALTMNTDNSHTKLQGTSILQSDVSATRSDNYGKIVKKKNGHLKSF